jgi:hypoxanthine phosphoribosyltransferase
MGAAEALLSEGEVRAAVEGLADELLPRLRPGAVAVCLLTGGIWFAADLTRALYRRGADLAFDALWLASYGDARRSSGAIAVRAGLQREVHGLQVLLIDDVLDTGLSLKAARRLLVDAGADEILTCVFARKAGAAGRGGACDFAAWEAPERYLTGYGMETAGLGRARPGVAALD